MEIFLHSSESDIFLNYYFKMYKMYGQICFVIFLSCFDPSMAAGASVSCRDKSNQMRQDGGLCFEIPPWQHQPVELNEHVTRLRSRWAHALGNTRRNSNLMLSNSEITRYMDTVVAPFLDTYHRNIQNSYQQLTSKILKRIKEEINIAVKRKQQIYSELIGLANELQVPPMCDEERRAAKTVASNFVAAIYACTESARLSIAKMGKYAEDMIAITRNHMQASVGNTAKAYGLNATNSKVLTKDDVKACLKTLSKAAAELGYELDLSLTNAQRHNEQSCEHLGSCISKAKKYTDEAVNGLRDRLKECVYA